MIVLFVQKSWIKKLCIIKTIKQRLWSLIVKLIDFFGKQLPNQCLRRSAKLTPSWQDGSWWSTFLHSLSSSKWLLNRYWSSCSCLRVYRSLNRRMKISDLWITFILLDKLLFQQDVQWTKYWLWFAECTLQAYSALQHRNNVLRLCCDFNNGT